MIEIENVDIVKYGRTLYRDFYWSLERGENWIIEGPNGSGKTILLEMLSGMSYIPKGQIHYDFVNGATWDLRYAEKNKFIVYIPAHALRSFLDGHDIFYQQRYYAMENHRIPLVKDILGDSLALVSDRHLPLSLSIDHLLPLEVSRLSNGQLKKLLLVKLFLKEVPKLLLLDYPFEGLDYESREDLCQFIDRIAREYQVQVVIVDHQGHLPQCMNRRLTMDNFSIVKSENVAVERQKKKQEKREQSTTGNLSVRVGEPIIDIRKLNLRYGNYDVFRDFCWLVNTGERWALTGKNGAGKTTLFSLVFADHPQAYAQEIYLFGRRRGSGESIWDIKKRINYLGPEQSSFLDSTSVTMTGREYAKTVNGYAQSGFDALIQYFDANTFIDKPLRALSSGELQLLMILVCFISERELWLLDEPFQFLDPLQKSRLVTYLSHHLSREITLILITHNNDDIEAWTDKRMCL